MGNDGTGYLWNRENSSVIFATNNTERLRIDSDGHILLGTDNKVGWRYSSGDISYNFITGEDQILTLTGGTWTTNATQSAVRIKTQQGEKLTVLNNGNVGIGTNSPTAKLNLVHTASTSIPALQVASSASLANNDIVRFQINGLTNGFRMFQDASSVVNYTFQDGNVGIGTTTPDVLLQLRSNINTIPANTDFAMRSGKSFRFLGDGDGNADYGSYIEAPTKGIITIGTRWVGGDEGGLTVNRANVGIGTTSPTSKLHIEGAAANYLQTIKNTTAGGDYLQMLAETGDAVFEFQSGGTGGEATLNMYRDGTQYVKISADAGVNNYFNNGSNVGIGTTSPATVLDVRGAGSVSLPATTGTTVSTGTRFRLGQNTTQTRILDFGVSSSTQGAWLQATDRNDLSITMPFLINPNGGNVGIGTNSPDEKLDVENGNIRLKSNSDGNTGIFRMYDASGTESGQIYPAGGDLKIYSPNDILFTQTGNVGIGTDNPDNRLDVVASDVNITPNTESSAVFRRNGNNYLTILSNASNEGGILFGNAVDDNDGGVSYKHNTQSMQFATADVERMRITSGGEVLIGKTSATNAVAGLDLQNNSTWGGLIKFTRINDTTTQFHNIFYKATGGIVGSISTTDTATAFNTSSDYRLKEDLQDFNALDIASKIKMYDFKWKADNSRSYGVMAHELEEVLPQAVSGKKDAEEMQGVDYSKLVPILLKSIQELKAEVDELKKNK